MLIWVPTAEAAAALDGLAGPGTPVDLEQVAPGGKPLPASAAQVELYVPPFFPGQPAIAAMRQMPRLSVVQALTAGVDRLLAELPDGVTLCNARGAHDASTAEWVVAAILAALREFPRFALEQAAGRWSYQFTGCLAGQTVLIVGYGSIGAAVERRLARFMGDGRGGGRRPPGGRIPGSPAADVGVVLTPVTRETIGMVDAGFLARMKDGALLVNAARGSLVATGALCDELSRGRLRAVLDVTDPEPLPPGQPLWALPGVFFTPHVAASTPVSTARALSLVREQVERFIKGQPLQNVIDRKSTR